MQPRDTFSVLGGSFGQGQPSSHDFWRMLAQKRGRWRLVIKDELSVHCFSCTVDKALVKLLSVRQIHRSNGPVSPSTQAQIYISSYRDHQQDLC